MTAAILSIGDELILGQTVDTNSAWLSAQIAAIGIDPVLHLTVSDAQKSIEDAIRQAADAADLLLVSGGIGPTEDDLTRQALAAVLNVPLELDPAALENVERIFKQLKRPMAERNRIQAMLPRGTQMIENTNGTAPGIRARLSTQHAALSTDVFIMPGVPSEMKRMFTRSILPELMSSSGGAAILSRTLHTFGLGESVVADKLGPLMDRTRNPSVGTTVSGGIVSLRINSRFPSRDEAQNHLELTDRACRAALGNLIFGQDDETLPLILSRMLTGSALKITTAESCTGGLLAKLLTDIPGSSRYFTHGFVTYSNQAKTELLGVPPQILEQHGAVSEPVVAAMANGALTRANADFALAISGVAGPDGGTPAKPVGMVCIALAASTQNSTRTFHLHGDREMVRLRSAYMALTMLRFHLLGRPMPC